MRAIILGFLLTITGSMMSQNPATVTPKHLELPDGYPILAWQAQLRGTIAVRLKISPLGAVLSAESSTRDQSLIEHPLLQKEATDVARRSTFQCSGCLSNTEYNYTLFFVYKLEGEKTDSARSKVSLEFPNTITITARPPLPGGY